jgi:SulP family sulfate permease
MNTLNTMNRVFPFLGWFKHYNFQSLRVDALAGLTVALVLIPQSMAYAQLAGLPAYYGLYASFLPPLIAALFGSSRQLSTGPVAVVSILTAVSLEPLATSGSQNFILYAILLALMVGIFQLAFGLLRLGIVVNFISHPVANGFTNAVAIIIATSQLSKLFGVYVDAGEHHYQTIIRVIEAALSHIHWPTLLIGSLAFVIMYGLKRLGPRIPYILVAVVVTTVISWAFGFHHEHKAHITDVESQNARNLIQEFNATTQEISRLAAYPTQVAAKILKAQTPQNKDAADVIHLRHDLALNKLESDTLKKKASLYKKELRSLRFFTVEDSQGELRFHLSDETIPNPKKGPHIWRIRVDGRTLDEDALPFTGGVEILGNIPRGLPSISVPKIDGGVILSLFPYAIIIALLGFMEAISIAKAMAARTGQRLDPSQELVGQGLGNIFGSFTQSYPVSGSFSRSAINFQAGAISGLSSLFTTLTVIIVLLFFTPILYHLPQSVLAAVIMMAVLGLINVSGFIHTWKARWDDGAIAIITFISTLAFAPHLDKGIFVGVVLSLLVFLYKSMRPRVAILSKLSDGSFHDACTYDLKMCEHIAMVRFDGPLFFANATYLEDQIAELRITMPELTHILIVATGIDDMDATGEGALSLIVDRLRSAGYEISFTGINKNVLDVMKRTHLYEKIGPERFFPTQDLAVESIFKQAHGDTGEEECPLILYCPVSPDVSNK